MDWFRHGHLRFEVLDRGPATGETAVLLHGFPQHAGSWSGVLPRLTKAGIRVLAPDQRGYSPGARPPGRRSYRLRALAADVLALLDAAGVDRAHLVGHDWGGAVGWVLAGWHPDRVATLSVLSTPHPAAMLRAMAGPQLLRSWYMVAFQVPLLPEVTLNLSTSGGRRRVTRILRRSGLSEEDARDYVERLAMPGALTAALNWYRAMPFGRPSEVARVVRVPTLYVWGARDPYLGRRAAEQTRRWVAGPYSFQALPDAGHWLPEACPERVAGLVIEHVRRHPAAATPGPPGGEL
jgi:pimeloyl-ACP methyl ester carboxylesterase